VYPDVRVLDTFLNVYVSKYTLIKEARDITRGENWVPLFSLQHNIRKALGLL
jgi:hypothetical protein